MVYIESHSTTTNLLGLITLSIGSGTPAQGNFNDIDWSADNYYLNVAVDAGNSFIDMGSVLLKSVPYAILSAETSDEDFDKINITQEDLFIEQIGKGIIIKSPDGSCWRLMVDNEGNVITTAIDCP